MTSALPEPSSWPRELAVAIDAARRTAKVINEIYEGQTAETYTKGDGSPVTDADLAADKLLREIIGGAFPDDGFLTEEGAQNLKRRAFDRLWIIDPIDGTAQFIAGTGRFDVLIAFAVDGIPVVAVSIQPTTGLMHAAVKGEGAWRITLEGFEVFRTDTVPVPPRIVSSKWYRGHEGRDRIVRIATALGADEPPIMEVGFQPRAFDPTQRTYDAFIGLWHPPGESAANEWDIAASDLIIREAGGELSDLWGREYIYNKRNTHISGGLLVSASAALHERLLEAIAPELGEPMPALDPADDLVG
jgi:3'-phosphoadenosine 5'-phosphosulfate (PAPS) 3'-phosphatase